MFLGATSRQRASERGSALMAVIGVVGVTMIVALLVGAVTVQALGFTSATRAGVQSKAAAQSGIDAAVVAVLNASCAGGVVTGTISSSDTQNPAPATPAAQYDAKYTVTFANVDAGGAVSTGCPTASTTSITMTSIGESSAKGVVGNSTGDVHKVEARFGLTATGGGPAVYSYSTSNLDNFEVTTASVSADVQIKSGDAQCNNATIQGGVYAANGKIEIPANCTVTGDVAASGTVKVWGKVGGNITAGGTVTLADSARVGGNITTGADIKDDNGRTCGAGDANARAACYLRTTVVTWNPGPNAPHVKGTIAYSQIGIPAPAVPDWQDFRFTSASWANAGYSVQTWPAAWCVVDGTDGPAVQAYVNGLTSKTVLDARACVGKKLHFGSSSALNISLRTDVAFIAPDSMGIESLIVGSADSTKHQFLLITPDAGAIDNKTPDKPSSGCLVDVNSNVKINPPIAALIYSPCLIKNSANSWRGQLYGGTTNLNSNVKLAFDSVVAPGLNLGASGPAAGGQIASVLSNRIYLRDLDG